MACFGGCCAGKVARRGLLLISFLNFVLGLAFIGTGAVSIQHVGIIKSTIDGYCSDWCKDIDCRLSTGCENAKGCDCGKGQTTISFQAFAAPGAGFIAVGVFSSLTAILGCVGATRTTPSCLLAYIGIVSFIILLQFAFGVAAAVAQEPSQIITDLSEIVKRDAVHIDWSLMAFAMPAACTAVATTHNSSTVYRPACSFDNYCDPSSLKNLPDWKDPNYCCESACTPAALRENRCPCNFREKRDKCIYGRYCMYSSFFNIMTPVAGLALATIFFEVLAVCWALATWQSAKRGDYDQGGSNPAKDIPMDNM